MWKKKTYLNFMYKRVFQSPSESLNFKQTLNEGVWQRKRIKRSFNKIQPYFSFTYNLGLQ